MTCRWQLAGGLRPSQTLLQLVCQSIWQFASASLAVVFGSMASTFRQPGAASHQLLLLHLMRTLAVCCVQALGHHQAAMCVQVVSQRNPGQVLFEAAVQVMGSSLSLGPKQPLAGGIDATPEKFSLPR